MREEEEEEGGEEDGDEGGTGGEENEMARGGGRTCGAAADDQLALGFFCHSDLRRTETRGRTLNRNPRPSETPQRRSPGGCRLPGR